MRKTVCPFCGNMFRPMPDGIFEDYLLLVTAIVATVAVVYVVLTTVF